jgi:hypothetical protein
MIACLVKIIIFSTSIYHTVFYSGPSGEDFSCLYGECLEEVAGDLVIRCDFFEHWSH